ncbi:MAG: UDP-N-acetylmuramoyl-L-alanyl-D-glutamate--2,6-diaminopimelate ligase [Ruminococcaceae bacterium]|nr:UDP-N-acetylmuramoyl-L-alanyl-D-glutamate--2,6-diaminopimelate ligase [Oscillospiraceae bacterium]
MELYRLCEAAGISFSECDRHLQISKPVTDSREAVEGSLYICIRGFRTDGHRYIQEAIRRGAVCVLTENGAGEVPEGICRLSTSNTRRAAAMLFNAYYGDPCSRLKFIGVTGTNGKTSVTHLLRSILESSLCRCGLIGTVGCESAGRCLIAEGSDPLANMTTPDPPALYRILSEMVRDGVEYVLMEVTSHSLALDKTAPIRFEAGIFTNLTPEHLDFHQTMDAYANAKAKLFSSCKLAILNGDSPYADRMAAACKGKTVLCGVSHGDYLATDISLNGQSGVAYRLVSPSLRLHLQCPIAGSFSVMNSMQAAVCALELGFSAAAVKEALKTPAGVKGRMERLRLGVDADFGVIIDYAHTPDALEKLLRTARDFCKGGERVVVVFGCGGDRDRSKRPLMGAVAERYADRVILTSDNSRGESPEAIIEEIRMGMSLEKECVILDRREAIRHAILTAKPRDLILLAGKGHEEYEITGSEKRPFSEREIAQRAFEERIQKRKGRP